ncbi:MAG: T9SS type A sorting domain-containing protein [Chitinophagales bacterium]|nr:T9SS type A sorting domain-containing protein [Chitinophagales bacterium]
MLKAVSKFDTTIYGWNGSIKNSADQDWYKVKVKGSSKNYKIILQDLPQNYDLNFYDAAGSLLYQSINTGTTPDNIIANSLTGSATYSIQIVHDASVFDSLGCYHLTINNSTTAFKLSNQLIVNRKAELLNIFPNPSAKEISFSVYTEKEQIIGVIIYDLLGREVYSFSLQLSAGDQKITLPLNDLVSGPYQLVVIAENNLWREKFIKQ